MNISISNIKFLFKKFSVILLSLGLFLNVAMVNIAPVQASQLLQDDSELSLIFRNRLSTPLLLADALEPPVMEEATETKADEIASPEVNDTDAKAEEMKAKEAAKAEEKAAKLEAKKAKEAAKLEAKKLEKEKESEEKAAKLEAKKAKEAAKLEAKKAKEAAKLEAKKTKEVKPETSP